MSKLDDEIRVDAEELLELVVAVFERCGMSQADATLLADSLVDADLCGTHSHGVIRVPDYAEKLTVKGVNPTAKPEVVREGPSFVIVDGRNSMGQIGTALAMRKVIGKASQTGIAAGAIRGSNHCGAMAYFTCMALPHDMIGIATTNAIPTMAPMASFIRQSGFEPHRLALTHGHGDHILGAEPLAQGEVFAHALTPAEIEKQIPGWAAHWKVDEAEARTRVIQPTITYQDELRMDLGDLHAWMFPTPGHSPDGVSIYIEEHRLLFAGDSVVTGIVAAIGAGNSEVLERSLCKLATLEIDILVPGHGEVLFGAAQVKDWIRWEASSLASVREAVREVLSAGIPAEDTVRRRRHHDRAFDDGRGIPNNRTTKLRGEVSQSAGRLCDLRGQRATPSDAGVVYSMERGQRRSAGGAYLSEQRSLGLCTGDRGFRRLRVRRHRRSDIGTQRTEELGHRAGRIRVGQKRRDHQSAGAIRRVVTRRITNKSNSWLHNTVILLSITRKKSR